MLKDILCHLVPFNCWCRFSDSSTHWINQSQFFRTTKGKQNEAKRKSKYLDLARELKKKLRNMKAMVIPLGFGTLGTVSKSWEIDRGNYQKYSIFKINKNTAKNPGDLRRFVVTQSQRKTTSLSWCEKFLFNENIRQNFEVKKLRKKKRKRFQRNKHPWVGNIESARSYMAHFFIYL